MGRLWEGCGNGGPIMGGPYKFYVLGVQLGWYNLHKVGYNTYHTISMDTMELGLHPQAH